MKVVQFKFELFQNSINVHDFFHRPCKTDNREYDSLNMLFQFIEYDSL